MDVSERLDRIESRLRALEARLGLSEALPVTGSATGPVVQAKPSTRTESNEQAVAARPSPEPSGHGLSAGVVLGWTGAAALVLAAAYLIRLGIANGWLTPERQVAGSALLGLAMVGGGLALRLKDRRYSSLLGAGGVAVLYLTVFGAHLLHHLIGAGAATGLAVAVAALSLGLHALFREPLYVAFALLGSYACPLLLPQASARVIDLAIYLTVWNGVYCAYALWIGQRAVYFVALYASLLEFDVLWRSAPDADLWRTAAFFQLFQFGLFAFVTGLFSVRLRRPLTPAEAWAHFPALLLFYGVEYALLDQHLPVVTPWAAVAFAATLYAVQSAAAARLSGAAPLPSLGLVNAFGALVLIHAIYLNEIPEDWQPAAALAGCLILFSLPRAFPRIAGTLWPYGVAGLLLFAVGYLQLLWNWQDRGTALSLPLTLLYPLLPYAAYLREPRDSRRLRRPLLLAVGNLQLLTACGLLVYRLFPGSGTVERLWLSLAWALAGTFVLTAGRLRRDPLLARSALWIFALFAGKVLLFDLSEASPLVRVGCLAVLGVSLYLGGWIYRRLGSSETRPDARVAI
jgi:uncharacterized membrane protein